MVHHYTTIETLYSLLTDYKSSTDKEYLTFWASSILEQNDTEEMFLNMDDIKMIFEDYEKDNKVHEIKKLSLVDNHGLFIGMNPNEIKDHIVSKIRSITEAPFTISFSHNEDKLLMWSMYAKNGTGICLSFDEQQLICGNDNIYTICDSVVYEKKRENYENVIRKIYDEYFFQPKDIIVINNIEYQKINVVEGTLLAIAPFIKNKSFIEESEWRMAFYTNTTDNPPKIYKRITSNLNVVHYIKIKIPVSALKYVTIGPCANYTRVKNLVNQVIKECEIKNIIKTDDIKKSNVPYRIV